MESSAILYQLYNRFDPTVPGGWDKDIPTDPNKWEWWDDERSKAARGRIRKIGLFIFGFDSPLTGFDWILIKSVAVLIAALYGVSL